MINKRKYEAYYTDVADKFIDLVNMFAATVLGRKGWILLISNCIINEVHRINSCFVMQDIHSKMYRWMLGSPERMYGVQT